MFGLLQTPLQESSSESHQHNQRSIRQEIRGLRMSSAALVPTQGGFAVAVRSASPTGSDMPSMTLALCTQQERTQQGQHRGWVENKPTLGLFSPSSTVPPAAVSEEASCEAWQYSATQA